jgi:hypothetical protein
LIINLISILIILICQILTVLDMNKTFDRDQLIRGGILTIFLSSVLIMNTLLFVMNYFAGILK